MDWPHLHVLGNHLPIIGLPVAFVLTIWGLLRGSKELLRAAAVGAVLFGLSGWAASASGERADEVLDRAGVAWFDEAVVHEHEERAETAMVLGLVAAALGLVLLWKGRGAGGVPVRLGWLMAGVLAIGTVLMAWTGLAGGMIRHDEFQRGGVPSVSPRSGGSFS